ncbi:MAG: hypothetical protein DWQ31_10305 [Planctomycetota bacterium]|nr:MAG: hypothetical protein DWQ31_10305 [Planctomycetota bacterium]REJ89729.1 MAG: hypothetical protein DWQ35_17730 [Planctomycetota bacterium]REK25199.1 MAG: hypothetical protein DWQ42_11930 [Planctomycetota bacterium]REK43221.1 MAG: hypothetical protein DWQ46_12680 [Planctomycetota bacterium]
MVATCLVLVAGCQEEFPVDELGTIHERIPFVEGVEERIEIRRPRRRPARTRPQTAPAPANQSGGKP